MPKKAVFVQLEFGVMDEPAIRKILEEFSQVTAKHGKCDCYEVWRVEVEGEERDPDNPEEPLW